MRGAARGWGVCGVRAVGGPARSPPAEASVTDDGGFRKRGAAEGFCVLSTLLPQWA